MWRLEYTQKQMQPQTKAQLVLIWHRWPFQFCIFLFLFVWQPIIWFYCRIRKSAQRFLWLPQHAVLSFDVIIYKYKKKNNIKITCKSCIRIISSYILFFGAVFACIFAGWFLIWFDLMLLRYTIWVLFEWHARYTRQQQ